MALRHIDFLVEESVSSRRGNSKHVGKLYAAFIHVLFVSEEFFLAFFFCASVPLFPASSY
jgi:hypothetical protein